MISRPVGRRSLLGSALAILTLSRAEATPVVVPWPIPRHPDTDLWFISRHYDCPVGDVVVTVDGRPVDDWVTVQTDQDIRTRGQGRVIRHSLASTIKPGDDDTDHFHRICRVGEKLYGRVAIRFTSPEALARFIARYRTLYLA